MKDKRIKNDSKILLVSKLLKRAYNYIYLFINENCTNINIGSIIQSCNYEIIQYVPLFLEFYYILFHTLIIRIWFILNLACIILYMYNSLNNKEIKKRFLNTDYLKEYISFVSFYGILLLLFDSSVSIITSFMILYLSYRNFIILTN